MPDKVEPKDLEKVLARLTTEWQELAALLTSLGKSQDRVIEVEKILLRDAAGQYRGKISADPDGSADLFLCDPAGNAWARLGVNQAGEAFLELKDKNGESSFKVAVGVPSPGTEAEPRAESTSVPPAPGPGQERPPGWDGNSGVIDGQKQIKLNSSLRIGVRNFIGPLSWWCWGWFWPPRPMCSSGPYPPGLAVEALVVRDPNGRVRASLSATGDQVRLDLWDPQGHPRATLGLGAEGAPGLAFYDRYQRLRAELNLGPDGEPQFTLRDKHSLQGKTEPNRVRGFRPSAAPGGGRFRLRGGYRGQPAGPPGPSRFPSPGR